MNAAAGVLYLDSDGNPLLVQPSYKGHWDLPGGIVECGESPKAAAIREVKEELGLTVTVGRLLVVDCLTATRHRPAMVAYIFAGGQKIDPAEITVDGVEIVSWAFCDFASRIEKLQSAPILARRVTNAIDARSDDGCYYLEDGYAWH